MDKDNLAFVIAACVTVLILFVFMIFFFNKVWHCERMYQGKS